jgi:hypothetical protein
MTRRFLLAGLVLLAVVPVYLRAQAAPNRTPVSGTVVNVADAPLANAQVMLQRHTFRPPDVEGFESLAHGQTDAHGQFALGDVALKAELEFPIETGVLFEFLVSKDGVERTIDDVRFTAPRTHDVITSVAAEIHVH